MKTNKKRIFSIIVFAICVLFLIWVIVLKFGLAELSIKGRRSPVNLIPFGASVISNGRADISEIVLNALIFIPFGISISMVGRPEKTLFKVLCGAALSLAFETVQYVFCAGAADITDVITNTVGTAAGVFAYIPLKKLFKGRTETILGICLLALITFFFAALTFLTHA